MEFNDQHLVIIDTLKKEEAQAFIKFLATETLRHSVSIESANSFKEYYPKQAPFWESAILRHQDDICQARELIAIVKEKYND